MSNPWVQVPTQEQGELKSSILAEQPYLTILARPPGFQNFAQPASSDSTPGEYFDNSSLNAHDVNFPPVPDFEAPEVLPDISFHADNSEAQKDGPSLQVGHFCRLPNGHMEWVHNPYLPRDEDYQADVEMTTPLPQGSTGHVANDSDSASRRSMMATTFKKRMQNPCENRTRKGQIPVTPSHYQKRPNQVSKGPRRQVRPKAPRLTRMETVLEEEVQTPTVLPPPTMEILGNIILQ